MFMPTKNSKKMHEVVKTESKFILALFFGFKRAQYFFEFAIYQQFFILNNKWGANYHFHLAIFKKKHGDNFSCGLNYKVYNTITAEKEKSISQAGYSNFGK